MTSKEVWQVRRIIADAVDRDRLKASGEKIYTHHSTGRYVLIANCSVIEWVDGDVADAIEAEIFRDVVILSDYEIGIVNTPLEEIEAKKQAARYERLRHPADQRKGRV